MIFNRIAGVFFMSFLRSLKPTKPAEVAAGDKKFYQITCLAGGGVALVSMVLLLIRLAGFGAAYVWSPLALGLGCGAFFALSYLRYQYPKMPVLQRFADASVYFTIFGAYTPLALLLIRLDLYENGSIVCGWVLFGVIALFSLLFFVASVFSERRFRLTGALCYILMAFSLLFGVYALCNALFFSHFLAIFLMIVTILAFAASPVIYWFFDRHAWQMKVYYILVAVGTFSAALMTILYAFLGR